MPFEPQIRFYAPGGRKFRYQTVRFRFKISPELQLRGKDILDPSGPSLDNLTAKRIVADLQRAAVNQLHDTYVKNREQRSGRLEAAIMADENFRIGNNEIYLFSKKYLDQTVRWSGGGPRGPQPYWDVVERGTTWFVTRHWRLSGWWDDPGGPTGMLSRNRRGRLNFTRNEVYARSQIPRAASSHKTSGIIEHELEPHWYIRAAKERFKAVDANEFARGVLGIVRPRKM